jgi:uncharacterized protein
MAVRQTNTAATPAQVFLQPIAAPSILGLYGFAGATFMVAALMAGWYGNLSTSPLYLFPFVAFFGGLAQFLAAMWAFKARDGVATAFHGPWGSFWMAYGLLYWLAAAHVLTIPTASFPELGFWFIIVAAVTWVLMLAATAENSAMVAVLGLLALGATFMAIFEFTTVGWLMTAAAYSFIVSAVLAWYAASALMLEGAFGREVLPLMKTPPARDEPPISVGVGEPGVMHGQ